MFKYCSSADEIYSSYIYKYHLYIEYSLLVDALMCKQNFNFRGRANLNYFISYFGGSTCSKTIYITEFSGI